MGKKKETKAKSMLKTAVMRDELKTYSLYIKGELNNDYNLGRVAYNRNINSYGLIVGTYLGNELANGTKPIRYKVLVIENREITDKRSDWYVSECEIDIEFPISSKSI